MDPARALFGSLLLACAACGDRSAAPLNGQATPPRAGRFGSLRDLVLVERSLDDPARALFCDRFEVTRGDWREFAATDAGRAVDASRVPCDGEPSLAAGLVDLSQARAFARWRFLRLPRRDEWLDIALDGGRSAFPWGDRVDPSRANTSELGLWQPTPVGTFESGRQAGGAYPYDLIGNVSEWTESPVGWWMDPRHYAGSQPHDPLGGVAPALAAVAAAPALASWCGPAGLPPAGWLLAAVGPHVPRDVVGGDFATPMAEKWDAARPDERSSRRGCRLVATAAQLVVALCECRDEPTPVDRVQLLRFVARDEHRATLAGAWRVLAVRGDLPTGDSAVARLLAGALGVGVAVGAAAAAAESPR